MKQYLDLLRTIKEEGTVKPAARENMPGTTSLFGYQFKHDLSTGFPVLTTKKMYWKGVVVELLWFMKGDTNIKYLVDHGVNIWNKDSYNYYCRLCDKNNIDPTTFEGFIASIEVDDLEGWAGMPENYRLGDCGYQYGKVWREWDGKPYTDENNKVRPNKIDQIQNLIDSLRNSPQSRRHIVTAWDPAHDQDLSLTWCHALIQFNCRPLSFDERLKEYDKGHFDEPAGELTPEEWEKEFDTFSVSKYYLDCHLYQRSADVFLGVPFNIASYALLTHILSNICNMVPGTFIHSFGDVHIYENHMSQVNEQLTRTPDKLPQLDLDSKIDWEKVLTGDIDYTELMALVGYDPQETIKAELSTGLKK